MALSVVAGLAASTRALAVRPLAVLRHGEYSLYGLVATAQGAYAIDSNGRVWRFSESLRKQF